MDLDLSAMSLFGGGADASTAAAGAGAEAAWTGGMDADMPMAALVDHVLRHRDSPHRCLGLPRGVASACVRRRFHVLALRLHPDKTDHDAAAQAFAAVRDAAKELLQHQGQKTPR